MFDRIESILKSLGLAESYVKNFEDNAMDDDTVTMCFQNESDLAALKEVIPVTGHRMRFIRAFREQLAGTGGQVPARNESKSSTAAAFSAGPANDYGLAMNPTGAFGTACKLPVGDELAVSISFGPFNSGQELGLDSSKVSLDHQSGQTGASLVRGDSSFEFSNPFCTLGFGEDQSSSDSVDPFETLVMDLKQSLTPSLSRARSVQIMGFEKVAEGKGGRKIILFEHEFRSVIEKCGPGRSVAVMAVARKAKKGKSLFLSFVLRYLEALQQGKADWMGWNDMTAKPLEGFRRANGYEGVRKGIWLWSEPITCKNSKGQEFDVLLMDTQEGFDEINGEWESAVLSGMGLLTSSIMVLNTHNDIQEDTLKSLQNFLSFGILAMERDENSVSSKPFQNLVFLVRDWENYEEYPVGFGNEGGRKFVEKKLEFQWRLRREMKICFEKIDCFLLPNPGLATRESSFTGSVVNATPEYRAFAKQMQLCIEQLVNPDHFPLKTLNGNVLTAPDFFEIFKSFVEIFNADQLPSSTDLYNTTVECCNLAIVNKCVLTLVKALESSLSPVPFLNEGDFNRLQKTARDETLKLFTESQKMGDSQVINGTKAALMAMLDENISHYRSANENKLAEVRQQLETIVREIVTYEAELESKLGDDVLYEDIFEDIHSQVATSARQKFADLQCDPSLEPEILPFVAKHIQNNDKWLHLIKLNRERAEQSLKAVVADAESEYRNSLDPSKFTNVKDLEAAEAVARSAALKRVLKNVPRQLREDTVNKAHTDLTTQLDAVYEKVRQKVEQNFEAKQMNLDLVIENAVREYKKSMKMLLFSPSTTELQQDGLQTDLPAPTEDYENFHLQSESAALEKLNECIKVNSEKFKKFPHLQSESEAQLRGRIAQVCAELKRRNELKLKSFKAQVAMLLSEAHKEFKEEMKLLSQEVSDEATLTFMACKLKSRVKSEFERQVDKSIIDETTWNENLGSQLDFHMDDLVDQHVKIIKLSRMEDEATVKGALADARNFYSDQMRTARESKSWYTPIEFKEINDRVLEDTMKKVKKEANLTPAQAEKLRQSLQGLYSRFEEENDSCIPKYSHAIGIDLGTTYSCVGVYVNGKVEIIQGNEKFTIPSCVYYDEGKRSAVGEAAQDGAFMSPENFIFDAKRLIGRAWNDPVVQDDIKQWNFDVVKVDGQPRIKCRGGVLRPEEVSADVLVHLKSLAEKHLGQPVTSAVVTVPAYFNEGQRQATKDAATMAGLSAKILTEPVAAAIAYRLDRAGDMNKNILVFDLGGGTFDVAVLTITGRDINVKTINGDTHLGGEDFDKAMVKYVIDKVKAKTRRNLLQGKNSSDPNTKRKVNNLLRRLKLECERKKRDLSSAHMAHIRLEEVGWNLDETLMRSEFENLIHAYLEKCMVIVTTALKDANMSKNDIGDVVLVGGSTKIPKVHEMLKEYFNGIQLKHTVNPDQAVASGAAIQAAIKVDTTQGNGLRNKILVYDCTPSSIGIRDKNGNFVVQIPKGSKIPTSKKQSWFPPSDFLTSCRFRIFEGESPRADDNNFLGSFVLQVPSVRKEEAEMLSTTLIDDEGILSVRAVCLMNGNENYVPVDAYKGRMSKEEIEARRVEITEDWA